MARLHFICITFAICICVLPSLAMPHLKLVQVLFAHKLYAPWENDAEINETSIPETLSYESFISAAINIPMDSEIKLYNLGMYLRKAYDKFLGDIYTPEITKTQTTEHTLSILSAQLVNTALWPPATDQMWIENFHWQPIPNDYLKVKEDTLMLGFLCPNFISQINQVLQTNETREILTWYQPLFDHLSKYTGRNISIPSDVALLYATLETMANRNDMLPNWATDVFPDGSMYNVTLLEYDLLSMTPLQRQLNGGTLLGEIIGNSLKYIVGDIPKERKMMLYSGDARNIVGILKNLNLWSPHIPNEAAALIFELYFDNDTNTYGIKINYYTDIDDTIIVLSLPNCADICPLQTLINATIDLIPRDSRSLCGWSTENLIKTKDQLSEKEFNSSIYNKSVSNWNKNLIFIILSFSVAIYI
ncbi:venom acid phosphatase Acph-1 [Solenopsis invicta]|uniref:venom acid phosphatase Acph-1 n=1 Tax=Solenopsis invicta TaxID=13686 RepID=UPI00193D55BB|nr:venom acid phosphatase Acph-1 [Solenopsis invicta]XP_039305715.1 venom acid phosphatase Acph-1 [Solenopsis invicta]XP_039305716.1 venom acid phosphatase Acph-1 [Solenopsis invicta]XP_039305717.1 venom acid phosphatase Acph-1 [Solenopsis invicta]